MNTDWSLEHKPENGQSKYLRPLFTLILKKNSRGKFIFRNPVLGKNIVESYEVTSDENKRLPDHEWWIMGNGHYLLTTGSQSISAPDEQVIGFTLLVDPHVYFPVLYKLID